MPIPMAKVPHIEKSLNFTSECGNIKQEPQSKGPTHGPITIPAAAPVMNTPTNPFPVPEPIFEASQDGI